MFSVQQRPFEADWELGQGKEVWGLVLWSWIQEPSNRACLIHVLLGR